MNLTNRRLLSILSAEARFVCVMRLCATPCKWFNALGPQNGFMMQNECKHSQLCLKGLNGQDKPHYFLYFKRDPCCDCSLIDPPLSMMS